MILTPEDKSFFKQNGYLVKHDTLTEEQVTAGVDEVWKHIEADREDSATWVGAGPTFPKCGDTQPILDTLYASPVYGMAE